MNMEVGPLTVTALGVVAGTVCLVMCRRRPTKKLIFILVAGLLTVLVWLYVPGPTRYHIRETYSFQAGDKDAELRLAVMIPATGPYQEVKHVVISWGGTAATESNHAVQVVKLAGQIHAREQKAATVAYDVALHQGRARWEGPTEDFQLHPQPGIESDESALAQAASKIVAGPNREDAYRIHKFTAAHLSWHGEIGTDPNLRLQSALKAYQTRKGVCGHFANLMTALCRAANIPAQSISGLQLPAYPPLWSSTRVWGSPAGTHAWVEFHTREGWELADPSAAHWIPIESLLFGRTDGGHLSFGERISQDRIWEAMRSWAEEKGSSIGGMTGPLRFAAAADGEVSLEPRGTVKATWDSRWFSVVGLIGLLLVGKRWRRRLSAGQTHRAIESPPSTPTHNSNASEAVSLRGT
jgi:hypothetical protein